MHTVICGKVFAALALICAMVVGGCGDSVAPSPPPLTLGTFHLRFVDGAALPQTLALGYTSCVVTSAALALTADTTFTWSNICEPSPAGPVSITLVGSFRQAAADSVEFPVYPSRFAPPPEARGRLRGDSLVVITSGTPFGLHRWSFYLP